MLMTFSTFFVCKTPTSTESRRSPSLLESLRVSADVLQTLLAKLPKSISTDALVNFLKQKWKRLTILSPNQSVSNSSDFIVFAEYGIPKWFLNRQRCIKDGSYSQLIANMVDTRLREDLERMKKSRQHRGLRHYLGIKVRGQKTKSTGRTGKTLGVTKKK